MMMAANKTITTVTDITTAAVVLKICSERGVEVVQSLIFSERYLEAAVKIFPLQK